MEASATGLLGLIDCTNSYVGLAHRGKALKSSVTGYEIHTA